jgi:uncharacterized protein YkwD
MIRSQNPLRWGRLLALILGIVILFTSCQPRTRTNPPGLPTLNHDRNVRNVSIVRYDPMLQRKAQRWAHKLARENRLYHSNLASGVSGCWRNIGENVGYGGSIAAIHRAYMRSPSHRANILNSAYDRVGLGVARNGSRVFTVQVFLHSC